MIRLAFAFLAATSLASLGSLAGESGLLVSSSHTSTPPRPNILLVLVDDLGYSDLGCYGGEIETPRLDALAADGLRFRQFYNTGRCWPTRASLLSGYYAQQVRRDQLHELSIGGGRSSRPKWAELLPRHLATAGYRSYHTGKWHIDGEPEDAGFDRSYSNQGRYFHPKGSPGPHARTKSNVASDAEDDFYLTTEMADRTIAFLAEHHREHTEQPFFQYLAFTAPHFPLHAKPDDIARYDGRYDSGWEAIRQQRFARMMSLGVLDAGAARRPSQVETNLGPPYHFPDAFEILGEGEINRPTAWKKLTPAQQSFQAAKMEIHAAMVHRIDIELGRVLDKIESMDQTENTLVMFLSDNGASAEIMVRGDGHDPQATMGSATTYLCLGPGWSTVSNTPFRRHKTWTHEGGIATPMVVSWPARMQNGNRFTDRVSHVIDVVPTLLELAGVAPNADAPPLSGKSFVDVLDRRREATDKDERELWWLHDRHRAMRIGRYKAVKPITEPWELYDLQTDRTEQNDLAVVQSARLEKMVARWDEFSDDISRTATEGLDPKKLKKGEALPGGKMGVAQLAAVPRRTQVLLGGESIMIHGRHAFVMQPESIENKSIENKLIENDSNTGDRPWVFYAPTLSTYPDRSESAMHQRFLDAGIAVAGIDVGESYGSPAAFDFFDALYREMKSRGYSDRPVLLGRSRGGLWVSSWAIQNPERVRAIAGIYPVFDFNTYPGIDRAAPAYGMSPQELLAQNSERNPISQISILAERSIPMFLIHGEIDTVVPIGPNSAGVEKAYQASGAAKHFTLQRIADQGHNFWPGFFNCEELIQFVIDQSKPTSVE